MLTYKFLISGEILPKLQESAMQHQKHCFWNGEFIQIRRWGRVAKVKIFIMRAEKKELGYLRCLQCAILQNLGWHIGTFLGLCCSILSVCYFWGSGGSLGGIHTLDFKGAKKTPLTLDFIQQQVPMCLWGHRCLSFTPFLEFSFPWNDLGDFQALWERQTHTNGSGEAK